MQNTTDTQNESGSFFSLTVKFLLIFVILIASMVLSVKFGSVDVTVSEIMHEISIMLSTGHPGDSSNSMILWQIRIPRTIFAALCGMGLSLCGMVLQTMTRNDLADPYVLGVSSGASTGAVIAIIWGWFMFFGNYNVSAGAFIGAAISTFVVTMAAGRSSNPIRLAAICRALFSAGSGFDLDTLNVSSTEKYLYYTNTPANNKLDKFLKANLHENDTTLSELIGTKYMRLCQWDKAIQWLKDIPLSFYNNNFTREYRYYSVLRKYTVEPWIKRQWLDTDEAWEKNVQWWKHIKLDFCKEMQMMEGSLNLLNGKALDQRRYNLATYYAQASIHGDCWWLLHNAKSCYDNVSVNEVDFDQKAREMLQKVAMSSDPALKRKALFAMGYRELYGVVYYGQSNKNLWCDNVWDSEQAEYVKKYNPSAPQYRAYQALYELTGDQPEEEYIRKCDEYTQFRKYYRQHKN